MSRCDIRRNMIVRSFGVYNGSSISGLIAGRIGAVLSVSSTFLWGSNPTSQKMTYGSSGPFSITFGINTQYFSPVVYSSYAASLYMRRDDGGAIVTSDIGGNILAGGGGNGPLISLTVVPDVFNPGWYRLIGARKGLDSYVITQIGFSFQGNLVGHTLYFNGWQLEGTPFATGWETVDIERRNVYS